MKQKSIFTGVMLLLTTMIFGGCSNNTQTNAINNQNTTAGAAVDASATTGKTAPQEPQTKADLTGIIRSISGNQAVIAVMDNPQTPGTGKAAAGTDQTAQASTKSGAPALSGSTGGMGGPMGGPGGHDAESDATAKAARLKELLAQSKESVTVTIPVGIKMTKRGDTPGANVEASLTDLTAGTMVSIMLNDSVTDRKVAESVSIR